MISHTWWYKHNGQQFSSAPLLSHDWAEGTRPVASAVPWVGWRNTSSESGKLVVCGCVFGLATLFSVAALSGKDTTWHFDQYKNRTVMLTVCLCHAWLGPDYENTYSKMTTFFHTFLTWSNQETFRNKPGETSLCRTKMHWFDFSYGLITFKAYYKY